MSGEEKKAGDTGTGTASASVPSEQPYLDEHTTEPNAEQQAQQATAPQAAPQKWQMPKPKFQQSSGYLPQGYLKDVNMGGDADGQADEQGEQLTAERITGIGQEPAAAPAAPAIEPQPDLSEQLIPEEPLRTENQTPVPPKSTSRIAFLVLGLVGILLFLAVFLAAVYYFFLAKPAGGNNF